MAHVSSKTKRSEKTLKIFLTDIKPSNRLPRVKPYPV